MDDNVDINNNNSETTINLLLQLLANPKILQQATTMITQQTPSAPNPVSIAAATSLTGVVNTSVNNIKCFKIITLIILIVFVSFHVVQYKILLLKKSGNNGKR